MTNDSQLPRELRNHPLSRRTRRAPLTVFLSAIVMIFVISLAAANSVGFVPDYVDGSTKLTTGDSTVLTTGGSSENESIAREGEVRLSNLPQLGNDPLAQAVITAKPDRIVIPAIKKDLPLQNPLTRNIEKLTEVLKISPARYVDSALLGESGNMLLFGHSSHLPVVKNQMYKAFNDIEFLEEGDTIILYGGGSEYLYRVSGVRMVDAKNEVIDLTKGSTRLTLVTCNTLGEKSSRWVVEAEFIGITSS